MTPTKDQQAQEYAEKKMCAAFDLKPDCINRTDALIPKFCGSDIEEAYLAGATEALASQWRSVEEELPEDDRLVLAHFSDVYPKLSYATAYYRDGAWQIPDDWYYDCKIDFWKPIMPPSLPDTNTEKQ